MLTTVDHLKESIAKLEKEAPDSRLLKDFKEQLAALEFSDGKSAEQLYYSGNPVVPTSQPVTAAKKRPGSASTSSDGENSTTPDEDVGDD